MRRILQNAAVLACVGCGLLCVLAPGRVGHGQEKPTPPANTQPTEVAQPVVHKPDVEQPTPTLPETSVTVQPLPPEAHAWGRFPIDSWKTVRLTTEMLDAQGRITGSSVTETKTTLIEATDDEYALRVEVTYEVAGKRFAHPAQVSKHSYWGELATAPAGVRKVTTSEVELNGKKVACEVRQVVTEQMGQKRQSQICYSPSTYPYILKRESLITPAEGSAQATTVETLATNLPQRVLGVLRPVAFVRTERQLAKGDSLTIETQSPEIPGGVVSHSAQERDASAAVVRRTVLELLDFGVGSENPEEASPGRRRWFRSRGRRGDDLTPSRRDRDR